MTDCAEIYSATYTFCASTPWWEKITDEEWKEMDPTERLLLKMAIPPPIRLFREDGPGCVVQPLGPEGVFLAAGDRVTVTLELS